jgi:ankyrin repeat protein
VEAFEKAGVDAPRPYEYAYRQAAPPAALAAAAFVGDAGKIRRLLAEGTPVDATMHGLPDLGAFGWVVDAATHAPYPSPSEDGKTALHWACIGGQRDAAAALIEGGAKVEAADNAGSTPLHEAAAAGAAAVVSLLLSSGAAVDAPCKGGRTPLMRAVQAKPDRWLDVVDQLLASGAKISHTDQAGTAPIDLAAHHIGSVAVRALVDRGAKASIWNLIEVGETEKAIARIKGGASLSATRELKGLPSTPLDWALVHDRPEIARAIRARGGRIGLWRAVGSGDVETVRWYLRHGADPNTADEQGSTILHSAAGRGDIAMVRLLVKHGADVNAEEDWYGTRPLDPASFEEHQEVIDYLKRHGAKRGCYLHM